MNAIWVVILGDKNKGNGEIFFQMEPEDNDKIAKLKEGQNVVIEELLRDFSSLIRFEDCRLVSTGETKSTQQKNTVGKKQQRKKARRK